MRSHFQALSNGVQTEALTIVCPSETGKTMRPSLGSHGREDPLALSALIKLPSAYISVIHKSTLLTAVSPVWEPRGIPRIRLLEGVRIVAQEI